LAAVDGSAGAHPATTHNAIATGTSASLAGRFSAASFTVNSPTPALPLRSFMLIRRRHAHAAGDAIAGFTW